jgi:hypothetical protein
MKDASMDGLVSCSRVFLLQLAISLVGVTGKETVEITLLG